jgi:hypothetical protein
MTAARKAFVWTLVAVCVVVGALALWKLKVVVALVLVAFIIAAAMRPGVEWLHARRVPRPRVLGQIGRYGARYTDPMVAAEARTTTIKLVPARDAGGD